MRGTFAPRFEPRVLHDHSLQFRHPFHQSCNLGVQTVGCAGATARKVDTQHGSIQQPAIQSRQRTVNIIRVELNHPQQPIGPSIKRFQHQFRFGTQ